MTAANGQMYIYFNTRKGGQVSGRFDLTSIYGFSSTDIYAVGSKFKDQPDPTPKLLYIQVLSFTMPAVAGEKRIVISGNILNKIYRGVRQIIYGLAANSTLLYHYDGSRLDKRFSCNRCTGKPGLSYLDKCRKFRHLLNRLYVIHRSE